MNAWYMLRYKTNAQRRAAPLCQAAARIRRAMTPRKAPVQPVVPMSVWQYCFE